MLTFTYEQLKVLQPTAADILCLLKGFFFQIKGKGIPVFNLQGQYLGGESPTVTLLKCEQGLSHLGRDLEPAL